MQIRRIAWHMLFWLLIMLLGVATIYPYYLDLRLALLDRSFFLPVWLVATYLNWYVLMPRWLDRGQIWGYILRMLLLILLLTVVQRYVCLYWFYPHYFWNNPPDPSLLNPFIPGRLLQFAAFISLPVLCSIAIHLLLRWYRESYRARQILVQQQAAELHYLKAQINPHFLFNTLNSLYGLSQEASAKVPDLILKLSDVLSYTLYESRSDTIPLRQEIKVMQNFIDLELERFASRVQVHFNIDPNLDTSMRVAPLLFVPLLENAFKHGVQEASQMVPIVIQLYQKQSFVVFEVQNPATEREEAMASSHRGLGLSNLRRRLELLYPGRYKLYTQRQDRLFCAQLKLPLDD